jgi:hypothetical protein
MGAAGRAFVEGWVSPAAVAAAYESLFEEIRLERWRRRAVGARAASAATPGVGRRG